MPTFVAVAWDDSARRSYLVKKRIPLTPDSEMHPPQRHLLGIGFDHTDGHKRITHSDRFAIIGGSEETHSRMTETVVKTFETLDRKGKTLDTIQGEELREIIQESTPN